MRLSRDFSSPYFSKEKIPVEFLVLHYTSCDLKRTLEIFNDPVKRLAVHFVIDTDGTCYDLGDFYEGPIRKGAHAGKSILEIDKQQFSGFNEFSIGIEMVNLNGNILDFSDRQYESVVALTKHLQERFPNLKKAQRLVGHEHIAWWRGKCDPGLRFNWFRYLGELHLQAEDFHQFHACSELDVTFLNDILMNTDPAKRNQEFWVGLSQSLEQRLANRHHNTKPEKM